jgi:hypothetical protein
MHRVPILVQAEGVLPSSAPVSGCIRCQIRRTSLGCLPNLLNITSIERIISVR